MRKRCPFCPEGEKAPLSFGMVTLLFRVIKGPLKAWTVPDILDHLVGKHQFPVNKDLVDCVMNESLLREKIDTGYKLVHKRVDFPCVAIAFDHNSKENKVPPIFPGVLKRYIKDARELRFWAAYKE